MANLRLEWSKHPEYRWVGPADTAILMEHREPGDSAIHDVVAGHFAAAARRS